MGNRCANHVTPLYPQKLALTSPTGGGRSVGMVRSRTKATEFSFSFSVFHTKHTLNYKIDVVQLELKSKHLCAHICCVGMGIELCDFPDEILDTGVL